MADQQFEEFLSGACYAVIGASANRAKYGNKVFRAYLQKNLKAFPVNPNASSVEGHKSFPSVSELPEKPFGASIITPPEVTEIVVAECIDQGIGQLWLQPGAESKRAVMAAREAGINLIHGGPCILVVMGYRESAT